MASESMFFGAHVSNPVPVNAWLPRDKTALVQVLCGGMEQMDRQTLDPNPSKGTEGALR